MLGRLYIYRYICLNPLHNAIAVLPDLCRSLFHITKAIFNILDSKRGFEKRRTHRGEIQALGKY